MLPSCTFFFERKWKWVGSSEKEKKKRLKRYKTGEDGTEWEKGDLYFYPHLPYLTSLTSVNAGEHSEFFISLDSLKCIDETALRPSASGSYQQFYGFSFGSSFHHGVVIMVPPLSQIYPMLLTKIFIKNKLYYIPPLLRLLWWFFITHRLKSKLLVTQPRLFLVQEWPAPP